jgi:prepilin-type N-terminal cleavage/methylation domain-containing protein
MKNFKKGFTLIELLVVVAIIGILASVVLASLNTSRLKGADAAIKSDLANARSQAEILYTTWGGYGVDGSPTAFSPAATCANTADTLFADPTIWAQINGAMTVSGGLESCVSTSNSWAATVQLKQDLKTAWCVDSTGASKQIADAVVYTQGTLNADISTGACGT